MLESIISDDSVFSVISAEFSFSGFSAAVELEVGTGVVFSVVFFEVDTIIDFVFAAYFDFKNLYTLSKTQNN